MTQLVSESASFPNPWNGVPVELAAGVFNYLSFAELLRCSQVSQQFKKLSENAVFWRNLCCLSGVEEKVNLTFKEAFFRQIKEQQEGSFYAAASHQWDLQAQLHSSYASKPFSDFLAPLSYGQKRELFKKLLQILVARGDVQGCNRIVSELSAFIHTIPEQEKPPFILCLAEAALKILPEYHQMDSLEMLLSSCNTTCPETKAKVDLFRALIAIEHSRLPYTLQQAYALLLEIGQNQNLSVKTKIEADFYRARLHFEHPNIPLEVSEATQLLNKGYNSPEITFQLRTEIRLYYIERILNKVLCSSLANRYYYQYLKHNYQNALLYPNTQAKACFLLIKIGSRAQIEDFSYEKAFEDLTAISQNRLIAPRLRTEADLQRAVFCMDQRVTKLTQEETLAIFTDLIENEDRYTSLHLRALIYKILMMEAYEIPRAGGNSPEACFNVFHLVQYMLNPAFPFMETKTRILIEVTEQCLKKDFQCSTITPEKIDELAKAPSSYKNSPQLQFALNYHRVLFRLHDFYPAITDAEACALLRGMHNEESNSLSLKKLTTQLLLVQFFLFGRNDTMTAQEAYQSLQSIYSNPQTPEYLRHKASLSLAEMTLWNYSNLGDDKAYQLVFSFYKKMTDEQKVRADIFRAKMHLLKRASYLEDPEAYELLKSILTNRSSRPYHKAEASLYIAQFLYEDRIPMQITIDNKRQRVSGQESLPSLLKNFEGAQPHVKREIDNFLLKIQLAPLSHA